MDSNSVDRTIMNTSCEVCCLIMLSNTCPVRAYCTVVQLWSCRSLNVCQITTCGPATSVGGVSFSCMYVMTQLQVHMSDAWDTPLFLVSQFEASFCKPDHDSDADSGRAEPDPDC